MVCYSCNMLYSTGCEYAIRAMAYLASQPGNKFFSLEEIVGHNGLRAPFMAKTMLQLVRQKLVVSQKGPGGGFSLARTPEEICLLDIVRAIDGEPDFTRCAVGLATCSDKMPCPLHDSWLHLRAGIRKYLEAQSLDKLAKAVEKKLEYIKRYPRSRV
jgi:Rrf2 family protein